MNILIVEDEPLASERLQKLVSQHNPRVTITGTFDSVEDTVEFFRSGLPVDVAFLDIQLADGLSFEIFEQVDVSCPTIFTTAYDQYALRAFRVRSIDYLLKPIDQTDLQEAFARLDRFLPTPDHASLRQQYQQVPAYKTRFLVKMGNHYQTKTVDDIAYLYADGKATYLVSKANQRRYILDYTIEALANEWLDPRQFFRINRKFLMNVDSIREVHSYVNGRLKILPSVPCDSDMIVSRERVGEFKAWLNL